MTQTVTLNERYKLLEPIGAGGMATVHRAEDLRLGRVVAVKMLHEGLAGDELFIKQFQHEAHAAANLSHPNIVTVHDIGRHHQRPYIVMEYVQGHTLKALIREYANRRQLMPLRRALDLIIQVCHGIGYAHRSGLVHCDVKPQNVIVTPDERVKVADFGIARAMSQASLQTSDMVWGTPQYFSPEQAAGEAATPASDVYSLGIILFELLGSRLPFEGESSTAIALKHLQEPPPPIRQFNPHVPEQLIRVLDKILSKEPAGRYRTAGQLGRILSALRERLSDLPEPALSATATLPQGFPLRETPDDEAPTAVMLPKQTRPALPVALPSEERDHEPEPAKRDWLAVGLGLMALLALLGLIPLWYFVYLAWQ